MNADRPHRWRALLILPPVMLGLLILFWMAQGREPPALAERGEPTRTVRVVAAPLMDLVPTAEGYGPVKPARVWAAVSQVSGRVVQIHPKLRDGEILPAGTELLRIDPIDYELALAQAKAELAELEVEAENARASLAIEERNLELTQDDLARNQRLVKKGTASQSAVDQAERTLLATRASVQSLQNTLALIPTQRQLLEAKAARAGRDLEHTLIRAPFDLRVANLNVEADQYVPSGQTLFEGDAIDRVEVEAQVAMSSLRRLFLGRTELPVQVTRLNEQLVEVIGLDPLVRLDLGNHVAEWQAEFVRFDDSIDPATRTIGVVVAVDRPFDKVKPGYRPPLSKNMFVQVVLRGHQHDQRLIVPRAAIRGGVAYVADADDRLRRRPVEVLYSQDAVSVVSAGIDPGERVVVSDLVPAVEGMLLEVQVDESLSESLRSLGAGS